MWYCEHCDKIEWQKLFGDENVAMTTFLLDWNFSSKNISLTVFRTGKHGCQILALPPPFSKTNKFYALRPIPASRLDNFVIYFPDGCYNKVKLRENKNSWKIVKLYKQNKYYTQTTSKVYMTLMCPSTWTVLS